MAQYSKYSREKLNQTLNKWNIRGSYIWAAGIAIVVVAWILSGFISRDSAQSQSLTPTTTAQEEVFTSIRAAISRAEPHTTNIVIRGRTEALRTVVVRAETVGTIISVPVEEGSIVQQGELFCELSMNARQARKREAEAMMRQRKLEYDVAIQLTKNGHRSETQEAAAEAAYNAAQAGLERIEVEIEQTKIRAPFSGILDNRAVEIGDYMRQGDACATIVDESLYLVVGQVSEDEVNSLQIGDSGTAHLIDGSILDGTVRFISERADPATRTFRVELVIPNPDGSIRDGVTSEIRVPQNSMNGHHISPSQLVLNAEGLIGVRTVDGESIVKFTPITIIADDPKGVWITGLPETVMVITVGQEYVSHGQKVDVVLENGSTQS